ncbi:MAG: amidohydrolase family protein [Chloroflexi bacterium]|nr:amidohydrolase family protein [Chloroflexota bacterium]
MHDLVIRNGAIVDGTGAPRFIGDVAIDAGTISAVGTVEDRGAREIDAAGLLVTPGFVDIHTHYDGQATWDSLIAPSSWHGVTSVVMGNCGVGFAPAAPDRHDFLIALMEGVEDIPGSALAEGLPWDWESLPEYFDSVDRRPHTVDIGAQVPHAALRAYVMGERGADHEADPSPGEIEQMARLTKEGLMAGALGFATSRTVNHRSRDGAKIGSLTASTEELLGIGQALKEAKRGVFQFVSDFRDIDFEFGLMRRIAEECGRPLSVSLLQADQAPDKWRSILSMIEQAAAEGVDMKAQVCARPVGLLLGLQGSLNPFMLTPAYRSIAKLSLAERVARMRDPELRARIIDEYSEGIGASPAVAASRSLDKIFNLGDPPNYEPDPSESIAAQARRDGVDPAGLIYDLLLDNEGRALLYQPFGNYAEFNLDAAREMVLSDRTLFGLSDGGAHVGAICDASFPTYNIAHWCRDRSRGAGLPLEFVVKGQTSDTARHVGWFDRGVLAPGYKADLNVIDFDALGLYPPQIVHDLPAGGRRLLQRAKGYRYTIKAGAVTFENGEHTGELPGRLVRGAQPTPA